MADSAAPKQQISLEKMNIVYQYWRLEESYFTDIEEQKTMIEGPGANIKE